MNGSVGSVAAVPRLAEDAAVFDGNDEIFRKQGSQNVDPVLLVGFGPSYFQGASVRCVRLLLRANSKLKWQEALRSEPMSSGCA
jgi:hypothetical protein